MYRRILVPLDGSARAESVLPYVEELAAQFGASVVLLRVLKPVSVSILNTDLQIDEYVESLQEDQELNASIYLNGRCGEFRERKIPARAKLARGQVIGAIIETAATENIDLIAMASHGRTGLEQVVYGSVANGVLNCADCPVLLLHTDN